jgi:glycosyltransferase involved in cell wall biosynthesis
VPDAPELRVLLVGQGPLAVEVAELHERLRLRDQVQLLGYRDDATRILSAADALVLSSHHEGLPVALMEARALGLPVLATSVGGIPEVVRDGEDGLLVPPHRPELLAAALRRFATEENLRAQLAAGAATQRDRFDARRAVARLDRRYRALAAGRRSSSRRS